MVVVKYVRLTTSCFELIDKHGEGAGAIAITPDGETAYVVVWAEPGAVVPTATNTPGPPIQVGNGPYAIAIMP